MKKCLAFFLFVCLAAVCNRRAGPVCRAADGAGASHHQSGELPAARRVP